MVKLGSIICPVLLAMCRGVSGLNSKVLVLGRAASGAGGSELFTWPDSGVRFSFSGTSANVTFTTTGTNYFSISVDGSAPKKVATSTVSTDTLKSGTHTVEVLKVTEANTGTASITDAGIVTNGQLLSLTPQARRIEYVGDSITCAYGVEGVSPCSFTPATENAADSYAAITARNLNAEPSLVAWSGRGVTRNYPNADGSSPDPTMPKLWLQTSALDTTATYTFPANKAPQAVVVALGTNDFAYYQLNRDPITLQAFQTGVKNFVTQIFGKYPNTKVFLTSSPMLSDTWPPNQNQKTTQETAFYNIANTTSNVFVVSIPTQGSDVGCDSHPNVATHQQMATILTAAIQKKLAW